MQLQP